ncbi:MAG: acyl-CoA dehydrogenase C-terminal domain-containing protein [Gemmatimonadaceae bacterium]|nr:acyl-CoA dehydrogenase C-terminal domain-containing protein [Gemmatimonadaceae bacterium]
MPTYRAPVDDYRFLLTEVFDTARLTRYPGYEEVTPDLLVSVVQEAGVLCESLLAPLNMRGDAEGCTWENGVVRTPQGFGEAFRQYGGGGWIGLSCDPAFGGQGLPVFLRYVVDEMVCGANLSLAMYPGLTQGAFETIHRHASEELKARYLPKMATGEWTATMCLTEAHAGTDLGMIRTRAEPMDDGSAHISGTKIFITAGEHDLSENIVHLVLARLPDAPAGSRGISMFLVPKRLPHADGTLGAPNGVTCGSIEHKMGIRGSATCVMNFDGAKGWLVGEPHKGLKAMFTMMNGARLGVGLQGLGLADASYHGAVAYARERLQGRSLSGVKNPSGPADPIIEHADIRRGLLFMRAFIEGARALSVFCSLHLDEEERNPDAASREAAADVVALLTPVIKAFFTDLGFECTNIGLQTLGGHGYIRESGMEQFVRDARIGMIYEGTNHVQALDLVGRKLPEGGGRLLQRYAKIVGDEIEQARSVPEVAEFAATLGGAAKQLQEVTMTLGMRAMQNGDEAGAGASEYLRIFGLVALGHMWLRAARVAVQRKAAGGAFDASFYDTKLALARYYFARMMPACMSLAASVKAGAGPILDFPKDRF